MQLSGYIDKMHTSLEEGMAHYKLSFDDQQVDMDFLVGQHIELTYNKTIQCANPECKRITPKSINIDYPVLKYPTKVVSLSFDKNPIISGVLNGIKIGITKKTNGPSRWIDQGAISALPILEVKTRLESGLIEKALKSFITDKTNWRAMLKNETTAADLVTTKASLLGEISGLVDELKAK